MKRTFLLIIGICILLSSCAIADSQEYTQYTSKHDSILNISFSYPKEWQWKTERETESIFMMSTTDPENPGELGYIAIDVYSEEDDLTAQIKMEKYITSLLEAGKKQSRGRNVEHYSSKIDSIDTVNVIFEFAPEATPEGPVSIKETIFLLLNNQLYEFSITIPQKLRHGKFGQGFDYMISTIRILP